MFPPGQDFINERPIPHMPALCHEKIQMGSCDQTPPLSPKAPELNPPMIAIKTADGQDTVELSLFDMSLLLRPPPPPPSYPPPPSRPSQSSELSSPIPESLSHPLPTPPSSPPSELSSAIPELSSPPLSSPPSSPIPASPSSELSSVIPESLSPPLPTPPLSPNISSPASKLLPVIPELSPPLPSPPSSPIPTSPASKLSSPIPVPLSIPASEHILPPTNMGSFDNQITSQLPVIVPHMPVPFPSAHFPQSGQIASSVAAKNYAGEPMVLLPPSELASSMSSRTIVNESVPQYTHALHRNCYVSQSIPPQPYYGTPATSLSAFIPQPLPYFDQRSTTVPQTYLPPELLSMLTDKEKDMLVHAPWLLNKFYLPEPKLPMLIMNTSDGWTLFWKPFRLPPPVLNIQP